MHRNRKSFTGKIAAYILACVSVLIWLACQEPDKNVVDVSPDDPEIKAATSKAQGTVSNFISALQSPKPTQSAFAVKKGFTVEGDMAEHIWIDTLEYDGSVFRGRVANVPQFLKSIKYDDIVEVSPEEISDWKYIEDGKLKGGFSIRVFYSRMSEDERKQFVNQAGFVIE